MNNNDKSRFQEIDSRIGELHKELSELRKEREGLELRDKNYEGKFIYDDMRGYMYVTWQAIDRRLKDKEVMLQGISFWSERSEDYRDMAMFQFNALDEWYIPLDTFLNNSGIKIISRDEFLREYRVGFTGSLEFGLNWINKVTNDNTK